MGKVELSGWGRWPKYSCNLDRLRLDVISAEAGRSTTSIARGLGRAYGDSAINQDSTLSTELLNKFASFDQDTGMLVSEAGVSFSEIIEVFLPRGYFLPVTPGTKHVTLGGSIAADVHGKNHHVAGTFGDQVVWLDLQCADGEVRRCSKDTNPDLFHATIGGMGLTGHITRAAFKLAPVETGWIREETLPATNLEHAMTLMEQHIERTYSVAWIDCLARGNNLGRSLVYLGEHAIESELTARHRDDRFALTSRRSTRVPVDFPNWTLNNFSVRAFNNLYYRAGLRKAGTSLVGWDSYFYPLDSIQDWNRIYGKRGFMQYQCVLPLDESEIGIRRLIERISASGLGSFLAVLKRMGPANASSQQRLLSFPMEGYTLALDFPANDTSLSLLNELDEITLAHAGRVYLAKDSRMSRRLFDQLYGQDADAFRELRLSLGADTVFQSVQSRRLGL